MTDDLQKCPKCGTKMRLLFLPEGQFLGCPTCGYLKLVGEEKALVGKEKAPKKVKRKRERKPRPPSYETGRAFSSANFAGDCFCGLSLKDHPICQACGALVGSQHLGHAIPFRDRVLCSNCWDRWKKLDMKLGREASWLEMLKGISSR